MYIDIIFALANLSIYLSIYLVLCTYSYRFSLSFASRKDFCGSGLPSVGVAVVVVAVVGVCSMVVGLLLRMLLDVEVRRGSDAKCAEIA